MKILLVIFSLLSFTATNAQLSIEQILSEECKSTKTDTSIYSSIYNFRIDLPADWSGYLEGENPKWRIQNSSGLCSMTIAKSYASQDPFHWAKSNFDPSRYEIHELDEGRVLVEKTENGQTDMVTIAGLEDTSGKWIWRIRMGPSCGQDESIICDISYLFEQLIKEKN